MSEKTKEEMDAAEFKAICERVISNFANDIRQHHRGVTRLMDDEEREDAKQRLLKCLTRLGDTIGRATKLLSIVHGVEIEELLPVTTFNGSSEA